MSFHLVFAHNLFYLRKLFPLNKTIIFCSNQNRHRSFNQILNRNILSTQQRPSTIQTTQSIKKIKFHIKSTPKRHTTIVLNHQTSDWWIRTISPRKFKQSNWIESNEHLSKLRTRLVHILRDQDSFSRDEHI